MNVLNGVKNFLFIINENWTTICVIIGLIIALCLKIYNYVGKSTEEKVEIAKAQIQEAMLKMITEAEVDFEDWNEAGSIKRSQVIEQIYQNYPILSKVVDQESLIAWIDDCINESLKTLRQIVSSNQIEEVAEPDDADETE